MSNLSWAVDIRTHGIVNVIEKLLSEPWAPSEEIGREVPEATTDDDCVVRLNTLLYTLSNLIDYVTQECYSWEYGDFPK